MNTTPVSPELLSRGQWLSAPIQVTPAMARELSQAGFPVQYDQLPENVKRRGGFDPKAEVAEVIRGYFMLAERESDLISPPMSNLFVELDGFAYWVIGQHVETTNCSLKDFARDGTLYLISYADYVRLGAADLTPQEYQLGFYQAQEHDPYRAYDEACDEQPTQRYTFGTLSVAFDVEASSAKEAVEIANRDFQGYHDLYAERLGVTLRLQIPQLTEADIVEVTDLGGGSR